MTTKVLKFGAEWCGPCKSFQRVWDKVIPEFPAITFVAVDVDEQPEVAEKYGVRGIPAFVSTKLVDEGPGPHLDDVKVGAMSEVAFRQWLQSL